MSKTIVVFTVTGDQGSSVARHLLANGGYTVVGITRNPDSASAKSLAAQGVNLVKGNLNDPSSYRSVLQGAYGAFVNADFWVHYFANGFDAEAAAAEESKEARGAISAAAEAGVKHIVYSTLDEVGYAPHFYNKARTSQWARDQKYPVTHLLTSWYLSNLTKFGLLKKNDDGSFLIDVPTATDSPLPLYAVEQTGAWVTAAFNDPKYIGQDVHACSEVSTLRKLAQDLNELFGKKFVVKDISRESFLNEPEKYSEIPEMYANYKGFVTKDLTRDVEKSKQVYPGQWDAKAWAAQSQQLKDFIA